MWKPPALKMRGRGFTPRLNLGMKNDEVQDVENWYGGHIPTKTSMEYLEWQSDLASVFCAFNIARKNSNKTEQIKYDHKLVIHLIVPWMNVFYYSDAI